jgi:hypothetical protein
MSLFEAILGANKAKSDLARSGQIGKRRYETRVIDFGSKEFSSNPDFYDLPAVSGSSAVTPDTAVYEVQVLWDEKEYRFPISGGDVYGDIEVGNSTLIYSDVATDDPFCLVISREGNAYIIVAEQPGRHSFKIRYITDGTPKTINLEFLPDECTPVVIDLTQYKTTSGYSVNDLILSMLQSSVANGGTVASTNSVDVDGALRKALTTDKQVVVDMTVIGDTGTTKTRFYPTVAINTTNERVLVVSSYAILFVLDSTPYEVKCVVSFPLDSNQVKVYVKATPFA